MEDFPAGERLDINLEELDLTTLRRVRELIALTGGAGIAGEAVLADQHEDEIDSSVQDEEIKEYISQRERRIRLEGMQDDAERWKRLIDEVDAIIISKEASEEIDL